MRQPIPDARGLGWTSLSVSPPVEPPRLPPVDGLYEALMLIGTRTIRSSVAQGDGYGSSTGCARARADGRIDSRDSSSLHRRPIPRVVTVVTAGYERQLAQASVGLGAG